MNALKFLMLAGCLVYSLAYANVPVVSGEISFQADTVHLELIGSQNWQYDIQKNQADGKVFADMLVTPVNDATKAQLEKFKSEFVSKVEVDSKSIDGKTKIRFYLKDESIDIFDYLTDQPSRLIVDFYVNPNLKKTAVEKKPENNQAAAKSPKLNKKTGTASDRKPANTDILKIENQGPALAQADETVKAGVWDGSDPEYDRFSLKDYEVKEESVIKSRDNYYIPFPLQETPIAFWERIKAAPVIYEITPKDSDENKQARLLLTLFDKQRYSVFLKTQKWFKAKYPKSEYNEVIDFMTADVHFALWHQSKNVNEYDNAIQYSKDAIETYPKSPLAEKTSVKLGFEAVDRGDFLGAIRLFENHITNKTIPMSNTASKELARLGKAVAFSRLNKAKESIDELNALEQQALVRDVKVEAAYRKGDVWAKAKEYSKAAEAYQDAIKKYPEGNNFYPNAYFNQAEAKFLTQQYAPSMSLYKEFIKKFPQDSHSAFAITRLGELLDIFGADKAKVMGAYLETYFRFGDSPKAVVARLHLLSTRMKNMKPKEVEHAVQEIMSLAKGSEIPRIQQFSTVMIADGFTSRKEYQKAVNLLEDYYRQNPNIVDNEQVEKRIVSNINNKIKGEVDNGKFIDSLKTHMQYADGWLKKSNRLDTKFYIGRAYEMAGVPDQSTRYYQEVLNQMYALKGTPRDKEVRIIQDLPSEDQVNLRLASSSVKGNKFNQAYEYLKSIKAPEKMAEPEQIERIEMTADLLDRRGEPQSAIRYLSELLKEWKGQPQLVAEPYLHLSEMQEKQNNKKDAMESLAKVDELYTDSQVVPQEVHARALEKLGNLYSDNKEYDKAISTYQKLLNKYEESRPLSSIRYKLGEILFNQGRLQDASEVWAKFKNDQNKFWENLAQEKLKDSRWRSDYKNYIKRIPAMSESQQGQ